MQNQKKTLLIIMASVASLVFALPSFGKQFSIYDRQKKLMQDVNKAQKSKQLTVDEAKKMRKKLASVARKKRNMKRKNPDKKLTGSNKVALEKDLNSVSLEIKKLMLQKRVDAQKKKS